MVNACSRGEIHGIDITWKVIGMWAVWGNAILYTVCDIRDSSIKDNS